MRIADHRALKVKDLIALLAQQNPEHEVIFEDRGGLIHNVCGGDTYFDTRHRSHVELQGFVQQDA